MKKTFLSILITCFCLILTTSSFAQKTEEMPKWLSDHFSFMTEGTGRWIADNSKFKSENEPFDAYGTEWSWGVGKHSIKGRLFALKEGKEVGTFWEFRVFWHPEKHQAIIEQFGANGVYAVGEMRVIESEGKSENITEQTFYLSDGTNFQEMHRLIERKGEHETLSLKLNNGSWKANRTYIWKKVL